MSTPPGSPIRVLHVDDEPAFTDLTATMLEQEDDRFAVETVPSPEDGLDRIGTRTPDCIVSDYDMPATDGIAFLRAVREEYPELPFMLFTGKGSEAVASDAISEGVTDYLQKKSGSEQYELLANRIRNAVDARRETARADREAELKRLTEFAGDTGGFEIHTGTGDIVLTEGAQRILDPAGEAELSVDDGVERFHPADRPDIRRTIESAIETGDQTRGTWRYQPPDRDQRLLEVTLTGESRNGDGTTIRGAVNDVTDRRERQHDLQQIETLFEHAQDSLFLVDVDDQFTIERVNPAYEDATGLAADAIRGRSPRELFGEDGAAMEERYRECIERRDPLKYEEEIQFEHGETRWETQIAPVVIDGTVEYIAGSTRNVTETRRRERDLRMLQQAIDGAGVSITLADPSKADDPLVYVNDAFEEMTGYPPAETLGHNCRFLQGEDTDPAKVARLREAIDAGESVSVELRNYRKDGTAFWNRVALTPIYDDGDLVRYLGTQEDVTAQKEREAALEAERRLLGQALDSLDDLFYVLDADGSIRRCNQRCPEVTGYTESELLDMQAAELFPDDQRGKIGSAIAAAISDGRATAEADLLTADGEAIPHEFTAAVLTDDEGTTTGLVGIGRDLRDRHRREQRFRTLVEKSTDVISILDAEGRSIYQSPSIERVLGRSPEAMAGETVWEYIHPEDRERVRETFEQWVTSSESPDPVEYRTRHADGSWRWIEARGNNQRDNPAVEGYVVNRRDITEQKEREQKLQELKRQYETLAENFPNGAIFLINTELEYVRARGEELRRVGLSPEDVEGATPEDLFPPELAEENVEHYRAALDGTASTFRQEYAGGRYRVQTVPVQLDGEEIEHVMAVAQNVTEYAEDKRRLQRQNDRLEEFASVVSHDLRSPLTVAGGHLELAAEDDESDHIAKAADALDRSQSLIDDLLQLARGGEEVGDVEPVRLADVGSTCWQTASTEHATLETDTSQVIEADRSRLQQLLENLYRNAIDHGGGDVTVRIGAMDGGFYVADTGPGIPPAERERIFEAGYSTNDHGTGFGLRIVETIAEAHGWTITATDAEDGGARFEVTGVTVIEP